MGDLDQRWWQIVSLDSRENGVELNSMSNWEKPQVEVELTGKKKGYSKDIWIWWTRWKTKGRVVKTEGRVAKTISNVESELGETSEMKLGNWLKQTQILLSMKRQSLVAAPHAFRGRLGSSLWCSLPLSLKLAAPLCLSEEGEGAIPELSSSIAIVHSWCPRGKEERKQPRPKVLLNLQRIIFIKAF